MERTYRLEDIERSRREWADFSDEWSDYRALAGRHGILFPPEGTKWDNWEDDEPSQRAILIRAIREQPRLLRRAIQANGVASWSDVIERLLLGRDRIAIDVEQREYDWSVTKARRGAPSPIGDTLATIADSLGGDR